jgi:outer membrane immunogenic protein
MQPKRPNGTPHLAKRYRGRLPTTKNKKGILKLKSQRLRSITLGSVLLFVTASASASAADLGPYHPYNPPPIEAYAEPPIWQGAYIGINGGYGWSNSGLTDPDGGFGGGQIGYNWQRDRFVFGVEGDFQASDINAKSFGSFGDAKSDVNWFSTMRGRVGFANGPFLIYGTGGVAFADISNRLDTGLEVFKDSGTQTGYAVGGGLEWAFARNWSAKAEYLYLGFGDDKITSDSDAIRVNNDIQTVRVGLNYKF